MDTASLCFLDLSASEADEVHAEDVKFLESGIRLIRLDKRSLFPFGRRTLIEPVEEQSDHIQKDEATIDVFVEVLKQAVARRLSNLPHSSTCEPLSCNVSSATNSQIHTPVLKAALEFSFRADLILSSWLV